MTPLLVFPQPKARIRNPRYRVVVCASARELAAEAGIPPEQAAYLFNHGAEAVMVCVAERRRPRKSGSKRLAKDAEGDTTL